MKNRFLDILVILLSSLSLTAYATEDKVAAKHPTEQKADHHDEEKGHGHEDGHAHAEGSHEGEGHEEEEGGAAVGPDKGITEADEKNGFKLSPEAFKNFDLKMTKLSGNGPWTVPKSALVHSGEEVNLFRLRDGFFKRIDFEIRTKSDQNVTISSKDLKANDEVVIAGLGFLRVAELAATGGVAAGHSH